MTFAKIRALLAVLLSITVLDVALADEPFGIEQRVPWTTSQFRGRPDPPLPYRVERLYPRIRFKSTTLIAVSPTTGQVFVGENAGKIFSLPKNRQAESADVFLDCTKLVEFLNRKRDPQSQLRFDALYGMAFDPEFEKNGYCYVCYVVRGREGGEQQLADGTRVSRLRVQSTDPPVCDLESEELIISWLQGGHNGGCLRFGPDGCLYISSGDGGFAFPPDGRKSGQDLTTLLAKILRIDVRRSDGDRAYTIPRDNPFVDLKRARGETWAYGLRNPWKMSFDRATGDLWVGDVGWELWELVYRVNRGDNFGWSIVEGSQSVHPEWDRGPSAIVPATMEIPHTDGASITGGFVYRGRKHPELVGHYVFGDWETRRIWGASVRDGKLGDRFDLMDPTVRIVDFAEDLDGELYFLDHDDGSIFTLERNPPSQDQHRFPRLLSETGLFDSVAAHRVAPGVIEFSVNVEQWIDGATAARFIAVPASDSIHLLPKARPVPGSMFSRATDFPLDTVLLKTLSLETTAGAPASHRRIETQVLHFDGREWFGYTYEWNDSQTDASLVERAGKSRLIAVNDSEAPGGQRTHQWRFASRTECIRCHNPWSEYTLAFNLPQINRNHNFGTVVDNQIRTFRHIGLIQDKDPSPRAPSDLPRLTNPFDSTADVNARARSYLHVNCAHCHRFNGGGSSYFYLQHDLSLRDTKGVGGRPTQGSFGIFDAQIIAPGDPYRSLLYYRMSKIGPGHMPHLGAKNVDERALALMHEWIRQLPARPSDSESIGRLVELDAGETPGGREQPSERKRETERRKIVSELLSNPSRALLLAESIRKKSVTASTKSLIVDLALDASIDPAVRDLFEPFVPEERRTRRLGDSMVPGDILKLTGDLTRGRQLFHESKVVQCRNCHRIANQGTEVGPDLDTIGKKYDRDKVLESILQPSLQVEPKYLTWLVETKSGTVLVGLLIKRDTSEIVLRDAQNKQHRVPTEEVERAVSQQKSLMPDLLVRDFTAQQVADLVEYLVSLK